MSVLPDVKPETLLEDRRVRQSIQCADERPGTVVALPPATAITPTPWPGSLVQVARALLRPGDSFAVHGENEETLARFLTTTTGVRRKPAYAARYVFAHPYTEEFDVWSLPRIMMGRERRTTLVFVCRLLAEPGRDASTKEALERGIVLALQGPDIPWQRALIVDRTAAAFLLSFTTGDEKRLVGSTSWWSVWSGGSSRSARPPVAAQ